MHSPVFLTYLLNCLFRYSLTVTGQLSSIVKYTQPVIIEWHSKFSWCLHFQPLKVSSHCMHLALFPCVVSRSNIYKYLRRFRCDSWLYFLMTQCFHEVLLELALNASRNALFAKLSFSMNTSASLKSFHVILCKAKCSRLNFSRIFLFTTSPQQCSDRYWLCKDWWR